MRVANFAHRLVFVTAAFACILAGSAAFAVEITPLSQTRDTQSGWRADFVATDFGPLVVTGRHVSSIGPQSLSADLRAEGGSVFEFGESEGAGESSTFLLDFEIDGRARYSLTGDLGVDSNDFDGWTIGTASIAFRSYDPTTTLYDTIFQQLAPLAWPPYQSVFDDTGVILAGRYQIDLRARGTGFVHSENGFFWSDGTAQLAFSIAEIPEPGTAVLLASGLVMLAQRRRADRAA
jgi:hypothetical protein